MNQKVSVMETSSDGCSKYRQRSIPGRTDYAEELVSYAAKTLCVSAVRDFASNLAEEWRRTAVAKLISWTGLGTARILTFTSSVDEAVLHQQEVSQAPAKSGNWPQLDNRY